MFIHTNEIAVNKILVKNNITAQSLQLKGAITKLTALIHMIDHTATD